MPPSVVAILFGNAPVSPKIIVPAPAVEICRFAVGLETPKPTSPLFRMVIAVVVAPFPTSKTKLGFVSVLPVALLPSRVRVPFARVLPAIESPFVVGDNVVPFLCQVDVAQLGEDVPLEVSTCPVRPAAV